MVEQELLAGEVAAALPAGEVVVPVVLPAHPGGRVDEVIDNARRNAEAQGWDPELAEVLWRELVEWSIEREKAALGRE